MKNYLLLILVISFSNQTIAPTDLLHNLKLPIIFKGNDTAAYRDPAILYHNKLFYLYFTLVKTENGKIYSFNAESHSVDLKNWTPEMILTPKDQNLDFSSPGNTIKYKDEWILCLKT
jgi:beta-xylosidase